MSRLYCQVLRAMLLKECSRPVAADGLRHDEGQAKQGQHPVVPTLLACANAQSHWPHHASRVVTQLLCCMSSHRTCLCKVHPGIGRRVGRFVTVCGEFRQGFG